MRSIAKSLVPALFGLSAMVACGSDDLALDVGRDDAPDFSDIERRLAITIRPGPSLYDGYGSCKASTGCDAAGLAAAVYNGCTYTTGTGRTTGDQCSTGVILAERRVCAAQVLLTIVEAVAPREVRFESASTSVVIIPPQDAESNAEIARVAFEQADLAAEIVSNTFDQTINVNCTNAVLDNDPGTGAQFDNLTIGDELANFYAEAAEAARDAAAHLADAGLAVSDAAYSRRTDLAHAAEAPLAPFASRTAAAHMLVGGATRRADGTDTGLPGIAGIDVEGFFTRPRLSGEAQRALEHIRSAAIYPPDVGDPAITIDELILGGSSVTTAESIRWRLGVMQNRIPLRDASSAAVVYAMLGVSREAFSEAREYLREELRAFDRSSVPTLPAEDVPDGQDTAYYGITLWAATRNPPTQLLPSYWAAVLRYDPTPQTLTGYSAATDTAWSSPPAWNWRTSTSGTSPPGYTWGQETASSSSPPLVTGRRTVAAMLDNIAGRTPQILTSVCPSGVCGTAGSLNSVRDTLAATLADFAPNPSLVSGTPDATRYDSAAYLGRARFCWYASPYWVDGRIDVLARDLASADLALVVGRDGLDCAVRGTLEGAACTDGMLGNRMISPNGGWVASGGGFYGRFYDVDDRNSTRPTANTVSLYLVRRRAAYVGNPNARPGQYEELTGWVLPYFAPSGSTYRYEYCQSVVIAPELDRQAAALIQPSPTAGHRPATSCAGVPSDMLIPLENELTDDGSPVESSWRHYLELARRSATEADMLGDDLIRTGLEMDLRAEAAADALSRLCGVSINVTSVARDMEEDGTTPPIAATGPPCTAPYVAHGTQCVRDPVLYAASRATSSEDFQRLASCVGTDTVPWATLGDTPICIWDTDTSSSAGICAGATARMPCPYPADSAGNCMGPIPMGATSIPVTATIGIFQRPSEPEPPPPDPNTLSCDLLAEVRAGSVALEDVAAMLEDPLLTYDGLSAYAQQLSWEALAGDYSVVRYAGSVVFRTGAPNTTLGTGSPWPMGTALPPGAVCPGNAFETSATRPTQYYGPLFCLHDLYANASGTSGSARAYRARMNDLLARAVFAVRIFTAAPNGLSGNVVPYVADTASYTYEADPDTFTWDLLGGVPMGHPSVYYAQTGEFRIDHRDWDSAEEYGRQIMDFGTRAAHIDGSTTSSPCSGVPSGAEWAACPYDQATCREIFDDATDCDDGSLDDRNLPIVFAAVDDGMTRADAQRAAVPLWRRHLRQVAAFSGSDTSAERASPVRGVDQTLLTNYFQDWAESGRPGCGHDEYEDCVGDQPMRRLLDEGNRAFIGGDALTLADLLNGIELTCVAAQQDLPSVDTSCTEPTEITNLEGAFRMAAYFECRANSLSQAGADSVVQNLPQRVVDSLRRDGPGTYGGGAGEIDAAVSDVRASLIEMSNIRTAAAADLRAFSSRIRALRSAVAMSERSRQIEDLMSFGRRLDRINQCVSAVAESVSTDPAASVAKGAGAAVTCTNSVQQIILENQIARLRAENVEDTIIQQFAQFNTEATDFGRRFSERATSTRAALERIDGALTRIRNAQMQARRALSRALMLETGTGGEHLAVDAVYRARMNTLLTRYRNAHRRAVRSAFIARLALEQRLGMPLADLEDDIFSDEAPREWVDTICTLPSIDYDRIRGSTPGETGEREDDDVDFSGPDGYSGAYVGDYVRRLEDVFESYSFVHPFREGTDTAVISLRDDVFRTRAPCPTETPNLLYNAGRLDVFESSDGARAGWRMEGCDPEAIGGSGVVERDCLSVTPLDGDAVMPSGGLEGADFGRPVPYRVVWAVSGAASSATRLVQQVPVARGRYRVSWFAASGTTGLVYPALAISVDTSTTSMATSGVYTTTTAGDWDRYWFFVDVPEDMTLRVQSAGYAGTAQTDILLAGVMLENVTASVTGDPDRTVTVTNPDETTSMVVYGQRAEPPPYFETGDSGLPSIRACRDNDGTFFRREAWERGCARACIDGYDGDCPPELEEVRCYWQSSFEISSDTLQRTLLETDAGFAAGNHNYRIESVALNLVGTGLRDCEGRGGTSGCYASGNLPFSIMHVGPFLVRNARGSLYEAPIFPGRLESARALAAERYISNPISSADEALIGPYTRLELSGRPLGGTLVVRLWDDGVLRFDALEDAQLVLRYRYWQHQR